MKTTTNADGSTVVSLGELSVTISENGKGSNLWLCSARICGEWHGFFSGKSYKTPKAATRAAEKWLTAKAEQRAAEESQFQAYQAKAASEPKEPTPAWLEDIYTQLETSDTATIVCKL